MTNLEWFLRLTYKEMSCFTRLTCLFLCFLVGASPTASPDQSDEDKALKDWMIAVIAGVTGALIIVILVLLIYCFTIRKKSDRGRELPTKLIHISV